MAKEEYEQTIFTELLGDSPKVRVWDFLFTFPKAEFTISDLARGTHVSRTTLYDIWGEFEKNGFIKYTRTIGKSRLYLTNIKNEKVLKIYHLFNKLLTDSLEGVIAKEKEKKIKSAKIKAIATA